MSVSRATSRGWRQASVLVLLLLLAAASVDAASLRRDSPAPDFRGPRLDAEGEFALAGHRGEWLLVEFWASWCAPCWRALKTLQTVQNDWGPRGLRVVTVSVDEDPEKAREFAARRAAGLMVVSDPRGDIADQYAVQGMPASFLIGPDGRLVAVFEGYRDDTERAIERALAAALHVAPPGTAAPSAAMH